MNCKGIIFDLALNSGGNFSNINDFCDMVIKQYKIESYQDIIQLLNKKEEPEFYKITNENALSMLISHDVNLFTESSYQFDNLENFGLLIESHVKKVISVYQNMGLNIKETDIDVFFCDLFPKPFNNNKGIALAPDSYDEKKYGMKKGIYFLKSNISYYQSRLLVAHEVLHHISSQKNPELLARGLEEGLCELIGSYLVNSKLFDSPIPKNYIKYRRFKYANPNQKFRIYTDYMRLAYLLLKQVGIAGVVNIINEGREKIKLVENALIQGKDVYSLCTEHSTVPPDLLQELDQLLLGTIENEVLSPLGCYIVKHYASENNITTFAKKHRIIYEDCKKAFEEIQRRIYGCVLDNDLIEFSDLEQLRNNTNILYECNNYI